MRFKRLMSFVLIFLFIFSLFISEVNAAIPIVSTYGSKGIEETNATLQGNLTNDGGENCSVGFDYGLTIAYGTTIGYNYTLNLASGWNHPLQFPKAIWDYNNSIAANDSVKNFVTKGGIYDHISDVSSYNLTSHLWKTWNKASPPAFNSLKNISYVVENPELQYWILVDVPPTTLFFKYDNLTNHSSPYNFTANATSLTPGTLYHFRAKANNSDGMGYGSDKEFLTKPNAPITLAVSWFNNTNVSLTWIKGIGANNTRIQRKTGSYPTTIADGTNVYNSTGTTYTDAVSPSKKYYYRAWSYSKWNASQQWSDGNASVNCTTRPSPPYDLGYAVVGTSSLNITWLNGTGSQRTVIRKSTTSQPILPTDGTLLYNGTLHYKVDTISASNYYTLFSYNITTNLYSSPGTNLTWYIVWVNVYDSKTNASLSNWSLFITNKTGTQSYYKIGCTNPTLINISDMPKGIECTIQINKSWYRDAIFTKDIFIISNYFINVYLIGYNDSALYYLRVVETVETGYTQIDQAVEDATVTIKKYNVFTAAYEDYSSLVTDANGYVNLYLLSNGTLYKVIITKTGYDTSISNYIPAPPNEWGQTVEKIFRIVKIPEVTPKLVFDNMTATVEPVVYDWYTNFTVYFNITSSDSQLEWFTVNVLFINDSLSDWIYVCNITNANPAGGYENYTTNMSYGRYGFVVTIKKVGFDSVKLGFAYSDYKYVYTLWSVSPSGNLDTLITDIVGKSPVRVGNTYATWGACLAGVIATFVLFTFSPRLAGLGVLGTGITLGMMKMPFNIIGDAMTWAQIGIIIILGILLMMVLKKKT